VDIYRLGADRKAPAIALASGFGRYAASNGSGRFGTPFGLGNRCCNQE
jgi:hypothetical protein